MKGSTHIVIGATTSLILSSMYFASNPDALTETVTFIFATSFGSLIPDIDIPDSKINHRFPKTAMRIRKYIFATGYCFGDSEYQKQLHSHRGICHSLSACSSILIALLWLMFIFPSIIFPIVGLILGILMHILTDAFTQRGCMLLAPFSVKHYFKKEKSFVLINDYLVLFLYFIIYFLNIIIYLHTLLTVFVIIAEIHIYNITCNKPNIFTYLIPIVFMLFKIPLKYLRKALLTFIHKKRYSKATRHHSHKTIATKIPNTMESPVKKNSSIYFKPTHPLSEKDILAAALTARYTVNEPIEVDGMKPDYHVEYVELNPENVTAIELSPEGYTFSSDCEYSGDATFTLTDGRKAIGTISFFYIPAVEDPDDYEYWLSREIYWYPSGSHEILVDIIE